MSGKYNESQSVWIIGSLQMRAERLLQCGVELSGFLSLPQEEEFFRIEQNVADFGECFDGTDGVRGIGEFEQWCDVIVSWLSSHQFMPCPADHGFG